MKRNYKCLGCGHKFEMDIPEAEIKTYSRFQDFRIGSYENYDFERALVDVRNLECPKCKKLGMLQAEYKKFDEKIIKISDKENFILSPLYPWSFKPSKIRFRNGYQYFMAHFVSVGDYHKIVEIEDRKEIDKFVKDYPKWKKKIFDKEYYLGVYLRNRVEDDEDFRKELIKYDGYKIEFIDDDGYLGVKYSKNGKSGKNVYGKMLMKFMDKAYEEENLKKKQPR